MNKIILIGNVGREPEMTYTPSGSAVTKFSLAVSRKTTDKASGEKKDETTWFNIVAWNRQAEICSQYVHKGDSIYIEGRVEIRTYTDKENIERKVIDVVVSELELIGSRRAAARSDDAQPATAAAGEISGTDEFPF